MEVFLVKYLFLEWGTGFYHSVKTPLNAFPKPIASNLAPITGNLASNWPIDFSSVPAIGMVFIVLTSASIKDPIDEMNWSNEPSSSTSLYISLAIPLIFFHMSPRILMVKNRLHQLILLRTDGSGAGWIT